jgi:hypothetical protein
MITWELIQTAVTYARRTHRNGVDYLVGVRRSQANCIKFIGCGADSMIVDEWSAIREQFAYLQIDRHPL